MSNILELKIINELNQCHFYIPAYQRGYKWTPKEVVDLLNDINEFQPKPIGDTNEKTWYCLQPIVVKKRDEQHFEVIDGQQRLTTIFLILNYLNLDYIESRRISLFELDYETRTNTKQFLNELENSHTEHDNIDFYYIHEAYKAITNWFESFGDQFDKSAFMSKFRFNSKIIWYESAEEDSISIFTRINMGKIPLTNAELIKALFLNSANFEKNKLDKLRLKQLEIATEWDSIEHALQNDRFWYFLTENKCTTNRIEFIFDLMNEEEDKSDNYSTFRFFNKKFQKKSQENIEKNWKEIKDHFQRFSEWYNERELYHKIGYLICINASSLKNLYHVSLNTTKSEFRDYLDNLIREDLKNVKLEELQYGDQEVKKIFLLYNILTMLNNSQDNSYFPYDIYKTEKWDIEHITSVKDSIPDTNREGWLQDAKVFIDTSQKIGKELKKRADECNFDDDIEFKSLFEDIVSHFNSDINDDDINDVSNLSLLDSETNRGYKNAVFPFKRKTIINRDKAGTFIPICTKNVFLKYFSEYPPKISFWTQDDREKYEEDLFKVLNDYLGE
jgi:uncharacterized protein with ParB-like and HNH nuclease domain